MFRPRLVRMDLILTSTAEYEQEISAMRAVKADWKNILAVDTLRPDDHSFAFSRHLRL